MMPTVRHHGHQVLFAILAGFLLLALVRQFGSVTRSPADRLAFVLTLAYLGWLLSEARVTFARRPRSAPVDPTLLPYALARSLTAVAAVLTTPDRSRLTWWMVVTAAAFIGFAALRLWAIHTLGRFYSHQVARQPEHLIVTRGPYARLRHPAYTGMLGANAAFVAFFPSVPSVIALFFLAAAVAWRIRVEERLLLAIPGYAGYATSTPRLIPGLW
jgi:protein-S-isoprenylcysteine O-methyltransferase Ste14